jgi:NADH:ubiquinone oxidoreductase subunit 3 (subunit A)
LFSQMFQAALHDFFYVLLFLLVALIFAVIPIILSVYVAPHVYGEKRRTTYESGMPPVGTAWIQFGASYYLFALIFLAFDVDVLYLFPVLMAYERKGQYFQLLELAIFLFLISLTIVYAWRKGVFRWR